MNSDIGDHVMIWHGPRKKINTHVVVVVFFIVKVHFSFWNTSAYHQRALASRRGCTYCSLRTKPLHDLQISHFHFILPRVFEKEEDCTFCAAPELSVASCWSGARAPRRHFVISACEGCTCGAMTGQSANTLWFMGLLSVGSNGDVCADGMGDEKGKHVLWHM